MASEIKWLFFDVGGTLFDEEPILRHQEELVFQLLNDNGQEVTEKEFQSAIRSARRYYLPRYVNHLIWIFTEDTNLYDRISLEFERITNNYTFTEYAEQVRLLPGMKDLVFDLSQRFNLGIIANQPQVIRERLRDEGMLDVFQVQAISSEMGMRKPDLRFFLSAFAMAQCQPDQAAMVGDRLDNDVYPARMLGMTSVRLKFGPHRHQPVLSPEYLPHYTVNSVRELGKLLLSDSFVPKATGAQILW